MMSEGGRDVIIKDTFCGGIFVNNKNTGNEKILGINFSNWMKCFSVALINANNQFNIFSYRVHFLPLKTLVFSDSRPDCVSLELIVVVKW